MLISSNPQVATHSALFDFFPERRHALRATPHGEKPISVAEYEKDGLKVAKDRQKDIWKTQFGYDADAEEAKKALSGRHPSLQSAGYKD